MAQKQIYEGEVGVTWLGVEGAHEHAGERIAVEAENRLDAAILIFNEYVHKNREWLEKNRGPFYIREIMNAAYLASQKGVSVDEVVIENHRMVARKGDRLVGIEGTVMG